MVLIFWDASVSINWKGICADCNPFICSLIRMQCYDFHGLEVCFLISPCIRYLATIYQPYNGPQYNEGMHIVGWLLDFF